MSQQISPAAKRARQTPSPSSSTYHHTSYNHPAVPGPAKPTRPLGQTAPHINPSTFRPRDMIRLREEKREMAHEDNLCSMCTTTKHAARHTHFSTAEIRRFALTETKADTYMCPMCKKLEPVLIPPKGTRRVVLTSSTLYGVWDQQNMPEDLIHFELESIVGGRVRDMTVALQNNYMYTPYRLEVIVVAGINNIGEGQKAEEIIKEMQHLKEKVMEHSVKWKHNPPSYVSFCTLHLAPKFCSLYVPPNPPEPEIAQWVPGHNFKNRYEVIRKVNEEVKVMNENSNLKFVKLDRHGIKMFKSGTVQHKFDNKPGSTQIWREHEVFRKLHFTMENKLKLLSYISNCFRGNASKGLV